MLLPWDHSLAVGTLQTLAERQGSAVDPATEEEPGKSTATASWRIPSG